MHTKIKICGIKSQEALEAAIAAGADYVGLNLFEPSPRYITPESAAELRTLASGRIKTVLLLVNASIEVTGKALATVKPDIVQFHGSETPPWLKIVRDKLGIEVWKGFGVRNRQSLIDSDQYIGAADRMLFDAPAQALPGGTGTSFDWSLLATHDHKIDWGLAGGLTPENVGDALTATSALLVDTSSGVESSPGVKDVDKIAAFCKAVRNI